MQKSKQIIIVVLVTALMGALLAQPIKGLVKKDAAANTGDSSSPGTPSTTYETVSQSAKGSLSENISRQITEVEQQLANAPDQEQTTLLRTLAGHWNDVNKLVPLAFTYEKLANEEPTLANWLKTGDTYTDASQNLQDTSLARELNQRSIQAYEQAIKLDPDNLDAKTGLGVAHVSGGLNPMAGITLLLEVVKADPKNLKANKSLGLFSMQSRQFDKAIDRFKTVLSIQPEPESWFYLATSYENIGLKREAIEAFEKSKQLASDPSLSQFIDRKIEELSK